MCIEELDVYKCSIIDLEHFVVTGISVFLNMICVEEANRCVLSTYDLMTKLHLNV